jgi:hypothetical protein
LPVSWPREACGWPAIDQSYLTPLGSFFEPDPRLGFRGRPDFSGRFRHADFDVRVSFTMRAGFAGHEHAPDKLPAARSVFVLGDSFTWGYGGRAGMRFHRPPAGTAF